MNLTIFSFLFFSFLQWWKQTRNEMKFQLHSFCFSLLQCLMIVSNYHKTKPIVILFLFGLWFEKAWFWSNWSKWSKSQPHLQNMFWICSVLFSFFFLIWGLLKRRNVKRDLKSACSQQLVKFEKERMKRKVWFFAFVKLDETPSRLDWLNGWNWLQSNKQRFRQR